MFNIKEYYNILREYNIKEDEGHLLMDGGPALIRKVAKLLLSALGDIRSDESMFRLQKSTSCHHKNCVSPQCHYFVLKNSSIKSLLTKEDIIEIANEMDLDDIEEMGTKKYLETYNAGLPKILKLSPEDFRTVYAYLKGLK